MVTGIIFTTAVLIVLYGLVASTDKVLQRRGEHAVIDERMTEHRSRL